MSEIFKERLKWIDNLKAFAIILVVLGHNHFFLSGYISTFHVPIFFMISGYLFSNKKGYKQFIKSKFDSLIKPYFFFSITLFLFWFLIGDKMGGNAGEHSAIKGIIGIFYGVKKEYIFWQSGLWFVLCLFIINNMYYFISKYFNSTDYKIIIVICSIIGWITSALFTIRLPWSIDVSFTALVFFIIGNKIREKRLDTYFVNSINNTRKAVILLSLLIINILGFIINGEVSFYNNFYNNYAIFIISSLAGTILYFFIFMNFNFESKILSMIGKESLFILAYHGIAVQFIKFVQIKILNLNLNKNDVFFTPIIYCIGQIVICIFIALILRKIFYKIFK